MFLCFLYQRWQWDNSFWPHFLCAEHRQFLQPFSVWRTMTALTIIVCVENTGNSYNHYLCGEQWQLLPSLFVYGTQAKSLNVLCVEHSISILSMKMGLLWKCAQVLFGNSEYLYYYLMPAEHRWLILTIIICEWKHNYTHLFLCEKHNCDNNALCAKTWTICDHVWVKNTKIYAHNVSCEEHTVVTIIVYVQKTDISEHQLMCAECKECLLIFSVCRTQWIMTTIFSVQNTVNHGRHL